jgi:outer membrane protein assembly factor BamB
MQQFAKLLCVAAVLAGPVPRTGSAADWPQLQCDAAHSGYTADQPDPPYRLLWWRDLKEPMATASQPVVADGRLYVGTNYGSLYALDRRTGKTAWAYKAGGAILGSPAYHGGIVYANSMDHFCHAVDARTGKGVWRFETGEGIWAAPVVAEGRIFVAGRDGFVYALDPASGKQLWRSPIGGIVMNTPACADGRLYVAGGDMHVYAYDGSTGRQVWKSPKIPGAAVREYWLVAAHGTVILTTQLVYGCHHTQQLIQDAVMNPFNERTKNDPALKDEGTFPLLVEWFKAHPHHKTLLVLDAETGREKFVTPIITVNGGSCTGPPPAVTPDGWAYTVYANIWLRASGWAFFGRLKLQTGRMQPLITDRYAPKLQHPESWHWQPRKSHQFARTSTWDGGFSVIDQSWGVSVGGDIAFPVRDPGWPGNPPFANYYVISQRLDRYLLAGGRHRDLGPLNMGTLGGGQMHNTASPMAISGRQLFHKTSRSVIFAFEGK